MDQSKSKLSFFAKIVIWLICFAIVYLANELRFYQFNVYPQLGDTYDEFKAPFSGLGLVNQGVPTSWSWYPEYQDVVEKRYIGSGYFRIVKPWFDEPFLFSYFAGIYAKANGVKNFDQVDVNLFRKAMIKSNCLNVFLLFALVWLTTNWSTAVISSLLYTTIPTIVLASRLPISDNFVATFMLLSLLFTKLYLKYQKNFWLILAALISALSLHLKSTGIFIPVSLVAILWSYKKFRPSFVIIGSTIISLIGWFLYGYHYNWELFLAIMKNSSGRELFSPGVIINLFSTYRIGEKTMGIDGWILWLWGSLISLFLTRHSRRYQFLIYPLICYLVFFAIMSGHIKGWYRLPFFPLICWAGGLILRQLLLSPRIMPFFFFATLALSSSYIYGGVGGIKWTDPQVKIYQFVFVSLMAPFLLREIFFHHRILKVICQFIVFAAITYSLYLNYQTIFKFQDFFYFGSL